MTNGNREWSGVQTWRRRCWNRCGSKKSLIHGTAMSKVLFHGNASLGMILLPLMLYHALPLIIVSVIAHAMHKACDLGDHRQV